MNPRVRTFTIGGCFMELKFLGRGSGFNTKEGSTAAFFIEEEKLFLIDCGESTRAKIMELNLLDKVKAVYFFCTHTHSDHVGSLGNLALYCREGVHIPLYVVCPIGTKLQENLEKLLHIFGCNKNYYQILDYRLVHAKAFSTVKYILTPHDEKLDESYSLEFQTPEGVVYYSGDTNSTEQIEFYIENKLPISKLYLDTTTNKVSEGFHLGLTKLADIIPPEMRNKCYCMHVNNNACIHLARMAGFNVVECE